MVPLKLRALVCLLTEAATHGCDPWPAQGDRSASRALSRARVADYHRGAWREGVGYAHGEWVAEQHASGARYMDWCAAVVGWSEQRAVEESGIGEDRPLHRSGAYSEIYTKDALSGRRGRVIPIADVRRDPEQHAPPPGSKAIFRRASGAGHIETVTIPDRLEYLSCGGNEANRNHFQSEWRAYTDPDLVAFVDADPVTDQDLAWLGAALQRISPVDSPLSGFDLSSHNRATTRWDQLGSDHDFAIFRAADGAEEDPIFRERMAAARAVGLAVTGYHRPRQGEPIGAQVDTFLRALAATQLGSRDILPVIDMEPAQGQALDPRWWEDAAAVWVRRVRGEYGRVMGYTFPALAATLRVDIDELWIAHWGRPEPTQPAGWPEWKIHQYAAEPVRSKGIPPGHTRGYGNQHWVDLNRAWELPLIA